MSWTCKHLSGSDIDSLDDNGDLRRLYDDSKEKIENKNYDIYNSSSDLSDDDKYNHWLSVLKSHAENDVISDSTKTFYTIGAFFNDVIYMISATYYDSSDKGYYYTHALVGKLNDSKGYAFSTDFWSPQNTLMKSLGSQQMVFLSTPGGSLSFRADTARGNPTLFDYDNTVQTEVEETLDIDSSESDVAPTEDGSTQTPTSINLINKKATTIKTVRPLK